MGKPTSGKSAKVPRTQSGNVRDVKVDRIGPVTIYQRGKSYYLYYREDGKTQRPKIDGNLAVARATAMGIDKSLTEERPTEFAFERTSPKTLVAEYLDFVENVQQRAWRTQNRYRAALERFEEFAREQNITKIDRITPNTVEDFVRWLRGKKRARNGSSKGKKKSYETKGIKFILSVCRTAFNWAARNRRLAPYAANPFTEFPIDSLGESNGNDTERDVFTASQEEAFFKACNKWQRGIFLPLAAYGLRVGELTHLLIENVDFEEGVIRIRSKPELFWQIKTRDKRDLPLTAAMVTLFRQQIGSRTAGFVFLSEPFFNGTRSPAYQFRSDARFRMRLATLVDEMPDASEVEKRRAITKFCRSMGQIPLPRPRQEFMKLTQSIGCPEFTRVHDLRHLFGTRSQDAGTNPLLVQQITGHRSQAMLAHYTHFDLDTKRLAMEQFHQRFVQQETVDGSAE